MASIVYCDVCNKRHKTSTAEKFCTDCEENLCSECLDVHGALKFSAKHHVINVGLATDKSFTVENICDKHDELPLEFYCSDHDVLCCRSCMTNDHRTCEKLTPIEVASKDVKSSIMFEDISSVAKHLQEAVSQLTDSAEKSTILLKESKLVALENVAKLKRELNKRIDEMEAKCVSKINTVFLDLAKKDTDYKQEVKNRIETIQNILWRLELVSKNGSNRQIFLLLHSLKINIHDADIGLKEFVSYRKTSQIEFQKSDDLETVKSLGSVGVSYSPCDITCNFKSINETQAQLDLKANPVHKSF